MTPRRPATFPVLAALLALGGLGCTAYEMNDGTAAADHGPYPDATQSGIVFVGTLASFTGNVYVIDAEDPSSLINLIPRTETAEDLDGEYAPGTQLSASAPYGIPDPTGTRVAFVTVPEQSSDASMGRVSLARENEPLITSPSIEGLQRVSFDAAGEYLILTLVDDASGDVRLQVMQPIGNALEVINSDLGPVAVQDLQVEGRGFDDGTLLVSGVRSDPSLASIWQVPLPAGTVELLTADLERDALNPSVSPDNAYLAVELYDAGEDRSDIAVYDLLAGTWTVITADATTDDFRSPRWEPAPDQGQRLAFLGHDPDPEQGFTMLCVASEETSWSITSYDLDQELDGNRGLANLRWQPGGSRVLLDYRETNNASGLNETALVVVDLDLAMGATNPQRLLDDGEPELAHWSHDGSQILVWDRSVDTYDVSSERSPIRLIDVATGQVDDVHIELDDDEDPVLYIDYPVFLTQNTMWY